MKKERYSHVDVEQAYHREGQKAIELSPDLLRGMCKCCGQGLKAVEGVWIRGHGQRFRARSLCEVGTVSALVPSVAVYAGKSTLLLPLFCRIVTSFSISLN